MVNNDKDGLLPRKKWEKLFFQQVRFGLANNAILTDGTSAWLTSEMFIEKCTQILLDAFMELSMTGISYTKLQGEKYYALDTFDSEELLANLDKNAVAVERSVYDYVIYDSETVEKPFALVFHPA